MTNPLPRQRELSERQRKPAQLAKIAEYDEGNLCAARIVLAGRSKYKGLAFEWAKRIIFRLGTPEEKSGL